MAWFEEYVAKVEGVQGGAPVLKGTRTPIRTVIANYRAYGGDLCEVQASLPHLTATQIKAALAYNEHHRDEIRADEEGQRKALEDVLKAAERSANSNELSFSRCLPTPFVRKTPLGNGPI